MSFPFDKFKEECAVVGAIGDEEASNYCYLGLYAMQHRGQEGAGIVSTSGASMFAHRDMGLVADIFNEETIRGLKGSLAIGHTRYATCGAKDWQNLQPLVANFSGNAFAIAHNGNLVNADELRVKLEENGSIFSATSDTEVVLHLLAQTNKEKSIKKRLSMALSQVQGAYSLVLMSYDKLFAVRDPYGIRPLALGKVNDCYIVASETCAFDLLGAEFIREIEPGEILAIDSNGSMTSEYLERDGQNAFCVFEYVYFSRPDSVIGGKNVYSVRKNLGAELAKEHPADADLVIPVPDSGVPAAIGYAQAAGLPLELGLVRNHYVGRTFIEPKQSIRDFGVRIKLNANKDVFENKRVIVVDDSIVRGTTCRKLVKMFRDAGASEVHFRISSPPTISSCYYGIDTPSKEELIGATHSIEEIREYIGADSLGYLSIEGMYRAVGESRENYCDACFSENYRVGKPLICSISNSITSNRPGARERKSKD